LLAAQKPEGKKLCKYYVQRGLGLASEGTLDGNHLPDITFKVPLVVCITRLVPQKGLHLISHAIKRVEELVSFAFSIFFFHEELSLSQHDRNKNICEIISPCNFYINAFTVFVLLTFLKICKQYIE
jgi:pentose-5-phosphate-3-epimerase